MAEAKENIIPFQSMPANDQAKRPTTHMGADANYIETWYYRPGGEGTAALELRVRPYLLDQDALNAIDRAADEAEANRDALTQERSRLNTEAISLRAKVRTDELLNDIPATESVSGKKLARIEARVKE